MERSRSFNRNMSWKKAIRKRKIAKAIYCRHGEIIDNEYYDNLHQYSKNKIHCSCGMCSRYSKTNNKGRKRRIKGNYAPGYNPSHSERKRSLSLEEALKDYYSNQR